MLNDLSQVTQLENGRARILNQVALIHYTYYLGLLGGSDGKKSACNAGDSGSIPEESKWLGRKWLPTLVFLPGEFHGQRNLMGYSPWGGKESDMIE